MRGRNTERDAAICAAYQAGATLGECAEPHGLTGARVSQILKANGCSPSKEECRARNAAAVKAAVAVAWDADMDAALRRGLSRGWGMQVIAEDIGVCVPTANKRADELGLDRRRRKVAA